MSEAANILHARSEEEINRELNLTPSEDVKRQINSIENTEHIRSDCCNNKKDVLKNVKKQKKSTRNINKCKVVIDNKSKHKRKTKSTENAQKEERLEVLENETATEETKQTGTHAGSENEKTNQKQSIKTSSSKANKKVTKKPQEIEIEEEKHKVKVKPKSRLSLSLELKSKNKFKEDNNRGNIMSFFQKLSPGTQNSYAIAQKHEKTYSKSSSTKGELEKNSESCLIEVNNGKESENLTKNNFNEGHNDSDCTKNKKENALNKSTLIDERQNPVKEVNGHADKNSKRKKKSSKRTAGEINSKDGRSKKKSKESAPKELNGKGKALLTTKSRRLSDSSKIEDAIDSTNEESNVHEEIETDSNNQKEHLNDKELKKVRFSEEIEEYSPKQTQKNYKFYQNPKEKKEETNTEASENIGEVIHDETITSEEESSGSSENIDKSRQEQSKIKIKNAFAFMMDSRHKSIGQNLSGKEQENLGDSSELQEKKKKLSSRKTILEEWANAKGGRKRKLEDEEKGIVIEYKLKKRAKRLVKMLTERNSPDILNVEDCQETTKILVKKHKATRIIESDSEDSPDSVKVVPIEEPESVSIFPNRRNGKRKHRSENEPKMLKEKHYAEIVDDALDQEMFVKRKKPKLSITSDSSNSGGHASCEDNQNNDLKKGVLSTSLQQTELSSFFGILNKTGKLEVTNKNTKRKLQMKRNVNNSESNSTPQKSKGKKNIGKSILTLKKNDNSNTTSISDDFSNSSATINNHSNKGDIKKKIEETDSESDIEECMEKGTSVPLTPSSIKQWKMKLKMSLANVPDEEIEKLIQSPKMKTDSEDDSRTTRRKIKIIVSSDSDSDNEPLASKEYYTKKIEKDKFKNIKPVKLAPLFVKAQPKPKPPKLDEETIEARRKFLHSGIPDSLKKAIVKQKSADEVEYQIFPTISHVTIQPTSEQLANNDINFWALPKADLQLTSFELYLPDTSLLSLGAITSSTALDKTEVNFEISQKITSINSYLKQLKSENPNYPVYKAFKFLHQKNENSNADENLVPEIAKPEIPAKKSKRGRPKKKKSPSDEVPTLIVSKLQINTSKQEIWTDLYKPQTSEEIFGNHASISQIKTWLETWLEFSEEINMQGSMRNRRNSDSSDFENTDGESKDSTRLPGNTVILCGPHGSGKTMAVYALCNELEIDVLELNASSKRTGKRLLQELQEATQSHQVRKNDSNFFTSSLKKEEAKTSQNSQSSDSQSSTSSKRMCVLLIEDVDIVFEQDDNFITALGQLLTTSKRPVVLTTTDLNCLHLKKFVAQHRIITFTALSSKILTAWFQVLCLIEGVHVDRQAVTQLLERNKGDVRRTLLQLQFWVQSGGQSDVSSENFPKIISSSNRFSYDEHLCKDDSSNISWLNDGEQEAARDCLESFGCIKEFSCTTSLRVDLGAVWWNIPNLLKMPSPLRHKGKVDFKNDKNEEIVEIEEDRIVKKIKNVEQNNKKVATNAEEEKNVQEDLCRQSNTDFQSLPVKQNEVVVNKTDRQHLQNVLNIFETLAITDTIYEKLTVDCDLEPIQTNRDKRVVKNSLELNECVEACCSDRDLACEWSHTLLGGYVNLYKVDENIKQEDCSLLEDKRWRTKQNKCDETLLQAVPTVCHLDRNSVNLDYLSTLRSMARSEVARASNNNKRRNRFYNYLRGVGINCNDSIFQTVCNTFQHEN